MKTITIKGQEGKALGPDEVVFNTIASTGTLSFESMAVDEFTFTIAPEFLDASESQIPEEGQTVELFFDGQRVFSGLVTRIANDWGAGELLVEVTVSGPWWWLEQTPLSDLIDEETERPQFRCALGTVESHITRLFSRLETLGIPVALGEVAACYDIPTTTFRDASFARALSELVRFVPDAVGWWDYSGTGTPRFRLSRRDTDNARNLALGVDEIVEGNLVADYGLKIDRVSVPYAKRLENGVTSFIQLSAGGSEGTRQIVPVSGPELVDFVPPDPIDGTTVSSEAMFSGVNLDPSAIQAVRPIWREFLDRYSPVPVPTTRLWVDGDVTSNSQRYSDGTEPVILDKDGVEITSSTDYEYLVIPDSLEDGLPSWFGDVVDVKKGTITGTIFVEDFNAQADPTPDRIKFLVANSDFAEIQSNAPNDDYYIFFNVEISVTLVKTSLTDADYYKPLAYTFEEPPGDFAENLRAAQSWLPYSGTIQLQRETFSRFTGSTLNLRNGRPAWASMGALAQGETLDLFSRTQTINLGIPDRFSGATPVTRLERSSSDSVILL